jgi:Ca2+-binding EF-hand superfamily protein
VLYKRFRRLDRSGRGTISMDDLSMIPEIAMNPLSSRLTALFERDSEDRINFKSFVAALATFSDKSRPEARGRGEAGTGRAPMSF